MFSCRARVSLCWLKLGLLLGWIFLSSFFFQLAIFYLRLIASYFKEWIVTTSERKKNRYQTSRSLSSLEALDNLFRI